MDKLPYEKQLAHRCFCDNIQNIQDLDELRDQVRLLHLLYLRQQVMFARMAKGCVS